MIYICAGTLYLFQISVIVAGIVMLARINKLNNAKPVCSMGICTDDTEERCVNCTIIMKNLAQRMPLVLKVYSFFLLLIFGFYFLYTGSRIRLLLVFQDDDSLNVMKQWVLITQLVLEIIYCIAVIVAIWKAQKKRVVKLAGYRDLEGKPPENETLIRSIEAEIKEDSDKVDEMIESD